MPHDELCVETQRCIQHNLHPNESNAEMMHGSAGAPCILQLPKWLAALITCVDSRQGGGRNTSGRPEGRGVHVKPCCAGQPQVACVLWGVWMGLRGLTVLPGKWVVWSWWSAMRHVEKMKLRVDIQSTPRGSAGSDVRTPTPTRWYPYPLPLGGLWTPVLP